MLEELLEEARRRYPVRTRFIPRHLTIQDKEDACIVAEGDLEKLIISDNGSLIYLSGGNYAKNGHSYTESLYYKDNWATIISTPSSPTIQLYPF